MAATTRSASARRARGVAPHTGARPSAAPSVASAARSPASGAKSVPAPARVGRIACTAAGQLPALGELGAEPGEPRRVGELAVEDERRGVVEGPRAGELDRGAAPVVVVALVAPDVADGGVADGHPAQPGGDGVDGHG